MNTVIKFLKRIIFSAFILYGYNLIAANFSLVIPINIVTILIISFLGAPGVFALILFKVAVL